MPAPATELRRRRDDLIRQASQATTAADLFARASAGLRRLVPFDGAAWTSTDPATGFPTSPLRVDDLEGISRDLCSSHWEHELATPDVNLFRDLARADAPAASLRAAMPDPGRSPRYRSFVRPLGFHDELRGILRVGDAPWGSITLWRRDTSPAFSARETALVAELSAPLAEALRRHARPATQLGMAPEHDRPGLLLFDAAGDLVSINEEATAWLAELPPEPGLSTDLGIALPLWLLITMYRAAAGRQGTGDGTARTRVRSQRGRWLVCHASSLRHADTAAGMTAVVIEPALPAAIAPIVVEAYDLSDREQQIIQLIARGARTVEIADELYLSAHTVRDHIKTIFAKTGASSRGELTARLFAEFYEPIHLQDRPIVGHS